MKKWCIVLVLLTGLALGSCVRRRPAKQPSPGSGGMVAATPMSDLAKKGEKLYSEKGCIACHSVDGSPRVGPTFQGMFGKKQKATTGGKLHEVVVDENYIIRAIKTPDADIAEGYEKVKMVLTAPVDDNDIKGLTEYIKYLSQAPALASKGIDIIRYKGCITCHSLDGIDRVAPTFQGLYGSKVTVVTNGKEREITVDDEYIRRSIRNPNSDVVKGFHPFMMPIISMTDAEINGVIDFLKTLKKGMTPIFGHGQLTAAASPSDDGPPITMDEMKQAKGIYFNRCAGCHGMLRWGATGPALKPSRLAERELDTSGIKAVVTYGLPGGMPSWGKLGILNDREIDLMARYLQHAPPAPPEMSIGQMKKTWKLHIPADKRPTKAFHKNWRNFFGIVLRAAGQVAIIDGDTKKLINIVETGFAVHILRSSASGRYFYSIGRDGKVTMIDLWMEKPDKVAEVKVCYDARSVDSSKFKGFEDKYLIVGGYWPPSLIIMDGLTLKPLKVVCTSSYTYDTYEYKREARAAAIVASHHDPLWVVNVKETGYVWLVDYSNLEYLKIKAIPSERFLHDGGWDGSKRYVMMAANAKDTIVVVDTETKERVARIKVGKVPHPGRGANVNHPTFGPMWLTGHLGDNTIACIGTDPEKHKDYAWKVVKSIKLPGGGGGNLFIKTHPNSKWIWADRPLHPDSKTCRTIYIIDKEKLEVVTSITLPKEYPGRAVHFEYNKQGTEVWVSVWVAKKTGKQSAIFIFDDKNLDPTGPIKPLKVLHDKWLITPTGKFNVFNTTKDIY